MWRGTCPRLERHQLNIWTHRTDWWPKTQHSIRPTYHETHNLKAWTTNYLDCRPILLQKFDLLQSIHFIAFMKIGVVFCIFFFINNCVKFYNCGLYVKLLKILMGFKQAYVHFTKNFWNLQNCPSTNRTEEAGNIYDNLGWRTEIMFCWILQRLHI